MFSYGFSLNELEHIFSCLYCLEMFVQNWDGMFLENVTVLPIKLSSPDIFLCNMFKACFDFFSNYTTIQDY